MPANKLMSGEVLNSWHLSSCSAIAGCAGLKFGMYSDAGAATCAGYPGSRGYEEVDAQDFTSWGIDYLKWVHILFIDLGTKKVSRPLCTATAASTALQHSQAGKLEALLEMQAWGQSGLCPQACC